LLNGKNALNHGFFVPVDNLDFMISKIYILSITKKVPLPMFRLRWGAFIFGMRFCLGLQAKK